MNTRKITVPVRYSLRDAASTTRIHVVDVEIRELDNSEAPVAVKWRQGIHVFEYRLFEGHLWSQVGKDNVTRPYGTGDIEPPVPGDWTSAVSRRTLLAHPLQIRNPVGKTDHVKHVHFDKGEYFPHKKYDLALAHVRDTVAGTIIVDDYLWRPSLGPVIRLHPDTARGVLNYDHGEVHEMRLAKNRMHAFDAYDAEAVIATVAARYPRGVELTGHAPKILIEDGYRRDTVAGAAAEAAAWDMLWWMDQGAPWNAVDADPRTNVHAGSLTPSGIAAVVALRGVLEAAWPTEYPGQFSPPGRATHYSHLLNHAIGRMPPLHADIAPALSELLPHVADRAGMRKSRPWQLAVERLPPELSADDHMAFGAMSL